MIKMLLHTFLLLFLCTGTTATNYVRGAINLLGSSGSASSFPAAQAVAIADEMLSLFNQTATTTGTTVLSVEVEAADAAIEKANAIFILFSVEGETAAGADAIFAALKVPVQGETEKVTSQFIQHLSDALRKNDAFNRIQNVLSLDLSTIIPLEKWGDDGLSPVPPPAPGSAPVRQKEVESNSTKSDKEKSNDLDPTEGITIGITSGSILLFIIVVGLVIARKRAKKGAALRLRMEKEPLLKFLPGTKHATQRELINIFNDYDGDGTKQIDLEELMALMNEQLMAHGLVLADQDLDEAHVKVIMRALDTDGDQRLSQDEFVRWCTEGLKRSPDDHAAFAVSGDVQATLATFVTAIRTTVATEIANCPLMSSKKAQSKKVPSKKVTPGKDKGMVNQEDVLSERAQKAWEH